MSGVEVIHIMAGENETKMATYEARSNRRRPRLHLVLWPPCAQGVWGNQYTPPLWKSEKD